jgi:hypothetical protein
VSKGPATGGALRFRGGARERHSLPDQTRPFGTVWKYVLLKTTFA